MFPSSEISRALAGFEILEKIGAGGAGQVFLAKSRAGKLVAIKVLTNDLDDDADHRAAIAREASMCARLNHTAIVQVRAFVESESFAALVFEYVPGVALARLLRHLAARGVRLPDRAAWHIVERVSSALACAHSQRDDASQPAPIVHRDVSPSNVLVDWTGEVKLADFGIAKMLGSSSTTSIGLVRGTLGSMAPEQARGEKVTERADVYAAALLAWRLATGRDPYTKYKDDEMELLRAMRNPRLRPLALLRPDLPAPLLEAIEIALRPDPRERTIGASDLAKIIRAHVDLAPGRADLERLLTRWRTSLEATVARSSTPSVDGSEHTARYEQVALAFDDAAEEATASEQALPSPTDTPTRQFPAFDLPRVLPSEPPFRVAPPSSEAIPLTRRSTAPLDLHRIALESVIPPRNMRKLIVSLALWCVFAVAIGVVFVILFTH